MAVVLREVGGEGRPVGDGWMACDVPDSWAVFAAGLGVEQPVDESTLEAIVSFYRERGRSPRVEVTPYQHPTLWEGLASRAFSPYKRETMLLHTLDDLPAADPVPGLAFRALDPGNPDDVTAFRASQMTGFFGDPQSPAGMIPITERVARSPRCSLWLLELDGRVVGSGGLEIFEDTAVLFCGCVYVDARRRGLHAAFIRFRLQEAATAGLRYATVASSVGGPTERNALRAGFSVVYTQLGLMQR